MTTFKIEFEFSYRQFKSIPPILLYYKFKNPIPKGFILKTSRVIAIFKTLPKNTKML